MAIASVNCRWFILKIKQKWLSQKLMNQIGKDTLKYYLFHSIALPFMELLKLPWNWYFSILYGAGFMFVFFFFNKTKLSDFAVRPISYVVVNLIQSKKQ